MSRRSERGQATTEFAIILPVFLLLLIGIFQAGVAYSHKLTLAQATRDGARKAVINRSLSSGVILAAAETEVRKTGQMLDQGLLSVWVVPGDNPDDPDGTSWDQGDTVRVRATYPWEISILGVVVASGTLDEETTLRME